LIVAPYLSVMDAYLLFVLDIIYISVLVSIGLNLLSGYAGQISIGHAAFYAIGAYSSAILQERLGLPFFATMVLAAAITAGIGYIVGLPAIRLHGLFLAMATLAFGLVIEEILIIAEPLTYGANGMAVPDATNGINLARYKTIAFALSAFYTGLAGALYAQAVTFIAPDGFTIFLSIQFLAVIIIGGMGSILGSILGAITLAALPEIFAKLPAEWGAPMIFYGAALILVIMFMPFGIAGWVNKIRYRLALRTMQTTPYPAPSASDPLAH
jgi:branched-chain amino acid transport system permease protein